MKEQRQNAAIANENDWSLGVDSYTHFTRIGKGYLCWATNIVNRGGMLQTRPGKRLMLSCTMSGKPQGACIFRPTPSFGTECIVFAVGGFIYMSRYPFTDYQLVSGLAFDPNAPMIRFCAGKKVSALQGDGTLQLLSSPYNVLIIQDGATAAGVFTGAGPSGYHIYGGAPGYGTPLGLHMCWSGNRLWVAREDSVFASDYLDPLTFSDSTYLATADNFKLPFSCTGMCETPDERTLLAFCESAVVSFQSQIADRTMWQQVTNFQQIIVPDTGSLAPRSIFNQYGTTWFLSEFGLTNINMAQALSGTNRLPPKDIEMIRSKDNLSVDQSGACGVAFETFALLGMPSGAIDNRHTWVIDAAPQSRLGQIQNIYMSQSGVASWAGAWTGTYPIEFCQDVVQGQSRCFELAKSCSAKDGTHLHIWENFVGQRWDYLATPIQCSVELRCFDFGTDRYAFKNVEVDLAEIWGEVQFEIWYAGIKGNFIQICDKTIEAEIGIFGPDLVIQYDNNPQTDTILESYRPQTRTVRSEEISGSDSESSEPDAADMCSPESVYRHNVDKGFQVLLRWTGACGIRQVRLYADPYMEPLQGTCEDDETGEINVLDEIGVLPAPTLCILAVAPAPPIAPLYVLHTTGYSVVNAQYELYILSGGTPQAPTNITLLKTWVLGVDVLPGYPIDFSPQITQYSGPETFLIIFRLGTGQAQAPTFSVNQANPASGIVSGTANSAALLGINTFYFTVANVDATAYSITHVYSPPPVTAPLYTLDTLHYRDDSYANITTDATYRGVINYPNGLGLEIWQLFTVYQPNSHIVVSQTMKKVGAFYEGPGFTLGAKINITALLDTTQFPFFFSVLRAGAPPTGKTSDLWAYAGAGNMQIGIETASDAAAVVHLNPPAALPGAWAIPAAQVSLQVNNPATTQVALACSPAPAQKSQVGFYWPGWDWSIDPLSAFYQGPCGIEVWDGNNNVLQRFTYARDFGPDSAVNVPQAIDLTALAAANAQIRLVRFSYFGTSTKTVYMDGDAHNPGTFELGEATLTGAQYPTDAKINSATVPGAAAAHNVALNVVFGAHSFAFYVQNVSNQNRYS